MAHHALCGIARQHLGELIEEPAPGWETRCESTIPQVAQKHGL